MNYLNKFKLDNKISLVTGGAGGIGIEICKSLLDAGSKVIIADIDSKKSKKLLKKIKNKNIEYYKLDSTSEKNIKSLSRFILKKYKRLDVLVNCVGICFNKEAEKVKKKEWDKVINININSMFYVCKEFGKIFKSCLGADVSNLVRQLSDSERIPPDPPPPNGCATCRKFQKSLPPPPSK